MPRKRNSVLDAIAAFNGVYDTVNKVGMEYKLADIANSKVETVGGNADAKVPAAEDTPVVTAPPQDAQSQQPESMPAQQPKPVAVTPDAVTKEQYKFLGKTYDKAPTESEQLSARNMAMAGVLKSFGEPLKGAALETQARQGAREEARFQKEQDYEKEFGAAFQGSRLGQNQQQYSKAFGEYQQKLTEYEGAKASGKTGPQLGLPPAAPARPEYTIGDQLADRASMLAVDAKYGKLDARKIGELSDSLTKLQNEGYESALRLAQSGAPLNDVIAQFNKTGSTKFDASSVVSDKMVKGEGGIKSRVITFRDAAGNTRSLNAVPELEALGKANEVYNRFFNIQQNNRANSSEGRAAYNFNEARTEKQDKRDASVALYTESNPNATQAQLNAVRSGVIDAVPKNNDSVTVDFKQDQFGQGGNVIQKMRDGTMTIIPVKAPADGQPVVIPGPRAKQPAAAQPTNQPAAAKPLENVTEADIEATAKKYNMSKEAVRKQLGLK